MAKRLLLDQSQSMDAEELMLNKLKVCSNCNSDQFNGRLSGTTRGGTRNECTDKPSRPFDRTLIYFASAAVSVDSSHMTASSRPLHGVDSVHLIIFLLMGTCRQWGSRSVGGHNH